MYEDRIMAPQLLERVMPAADAAGMIQSGMVIGISGFASAGYPQVIPQAIVDAGIRNLTVLSGASTGPEADGVLARGGAVKRRAPFQSEKSLRKNINTGLADFCDIHLSQMPKYLRQETFGHMDFAVIACCAVTEEGGIVPMTTLGATDTIVKMAEKVILEINLTCPVSIRGMHDIYDNHFDAPVPIVRLTDRIGTDVIPCPLHKIAAIVIIDEPMHTASFSEPDEVSKRIADHIIQFLKDEIKAGRMEEGLRPLQSGVGNIANAVMAGFRVSGMHGLSMYTEVLQDFAFDLIREGVMTSVSTTSLSLSDRDMQYLWGHMDELKEKIVIRSSDLSNNPEMIQRMGVIAMNTAVEADIYGNVNSTHVLGSSIINGVGGSCDFARNAALTIFMTPATAKNGMISSIVPMCSHVDSTEHDVHILVTEYGIADLRGKCPRDRAELIIENCCAPEYRPALREYFEHSMLAAAGLHTPHDLENAFSWHIRYQKTGTMKEP